MLRNKFFTFISLFGISFTVMILMIVMAFIDLLIGDNYPESMSTVFFYQRRVSHLNGK
jgi:putative ABC transport system permease protein